MLRSKVKRNIADETTTLIGGIVDGNCIIKCDFSWVISKKSGDFHGRLSQTGSLLPHRELSWLNKQILLPLLNPF